jgi:hypothetical protein
LLALTEITSHWDRLVSKWSATFGSRIQNRVVWTSCLLALTGITSHWDRLVSKWSATFGSRIPQCNLPEETSVTEGDPTCTVDSDEVLVILASLDNSPLSVPFVWLSRRSILVLDEHCITLPQRGELFATLLESLAGFHHSCANRLLFRSPSLVPGRMHLWVFKYRN